MATRRKTKKRTNGVRVSMTVAELKKLYQAGRRRKAVKLAVRSVGTR